MVSKRSFPEKEPADVPMEKDDDRQKRGEMECDLKGNSWRLKPEELLPDHQMPGARDGKELGEGLNRTEQESEK